MDSLAFSMELAGSIRGTYARLLPDDDTIRQLEIFCRNSAIKMTRGSKLHVTMVGGRKKIPNLAEHNMHLPIYAKVSSLALLPTKKGDKMALVLVLNSIELDRNMSTLMSIYGVESEFETFIPHLTLNYDWKDSRIPKKIPKFEIGLNNFVISDMADKQ